MKTELYYLHRCPAYTNGAFFTNLRKEVQIDFFGDKVTYLIGDCVFTGQIVWVDGRTFQRVRNKHKKLQQRLIQQIENYQGVIKTGFKILDRNGIELPDHWSGRKRSYDEAKSIVERLNRDGEYRPYRVVKV